MQPNKKILASTLILALGALLLVGVLFQPAVTGLATGSDASQGCADNEAIYDNEEGDLGETNRATSAHLLGFSGLINCILNSKNEDGGVPHPSAEPPRYLNSLDFSLYGCYCGKGNAGGEPVDDVDECCKTHDDAYDDAPEDCDCTEIFSGTSRYTYDCDDGDPTFTGGGSCAEYCFDADKAAAECFAEAVGEDGSGFDPDNIGIRDSCDDDEGTNHGGIE